MKNTKLFLLSSILSLCLCQNALSAPYNYDKSIINTKDVDKNVEGWKYYLNGKEIDLPDIYIEGNTKYLPVDILKNVGANVIVDSQNKSAYVETTEESLYLEENSKKIYVNNNDYLLPDPVIWKNRTLYIPTLLLTKANAFISENKFKYEVNVLKGYNQITDIKTYSDNTEQKITLDLSMPFVFDTEKTSSYYKVSISGASVQNIDLVKKKLESFSSDFKKVELNTSKQGIVEIIFYTNEEIEFVNTYSLSKPDRLIIHFPQIYTSEFREKKEDGLYFSTIHKGTYNGPLKMSTIEADPNKFNIKPLVSKESDTNNMSLKELSRLSRDYKAKASINGGFFSTKTKTPLGLVYLNGENITPPIYNRTALMIKKDGSFDIKNIDLNIFLKYLLPDNSTKTVKVHTFNQIPQNHQIVLFTDKFGKLNFLDKKVDEKENKDKLKEENNYILVSYSKKDNILSKINTTNDLKNGDYLFYATGSGKTSLEKLLEETNTAEIKFEYSEPLDQVQHALGGGPRLVKDGAINITSEIEKFKADITQGRAPRTALGLLDNGKVIMLAVDGRQEKSIGMTLNELAEFLQKLGTTQAINFDGGGSTAMVLDDNLVNNPSDPQERKISTGIFIFQKN